MNELFDIRLLTTAEDLPIAATQIGDIYIVGDRSSLSDKIKEVNNTVVKGLDKTNTFLSYQLRVIDRADKFPEQYGWNILCPIEDPASGTKLYIIASAQVSDLDMAVSAVINEAETQMRKFVEEALVLTAVNDPEEFKSIVHKVIIDSTDTGDGGVGNGHGSPFGVGLPGVGAIFSVGLGMDFDMDMSENICELDNDGADIHEAAVGLPKQASCPSGAPRKVSAMQRKQAFHNLPDRISATFMKGDSLDAKIVSETFTNMTAEEQLAIIFEYAKTHRNVLQELHAISMKGAFKYELILRPWKDYKVKYKSRMGLFIKDSKGKEIQVRFKHNPSFCIYVMHMLDRLSRKDEVTDLTLKNMGKEFHDVYKIILDEEDEKIDELFNKMNEREGKNNNVRAGRYSDYIKDIHHTFETLMGDVNSIPFKVGLGRYLQVPPSKISMPENLTNLKMVNY